MSSNAALVPCHIRRLPWHSPLHWLRLGWDDLRRAPKVSLGYGTAFAVIAYLLVLGLPSGRLTPLWPVLACVTLILFPALAAGFYHVSRRLEWGRAPSFDETTQAWQANRDQMLFLGLLLMMAAMTWALLHVLLAVLVYGEGVPMFADMMAHPRSPIFLTGSLVLTLAFGAPVLAATAISLPLTMHREIDFMRAIAVSWAAMAANLPAALLWSASVGLLISAGFAFFTLGLVIAVPLIGHATWHAYRDLVEPDGLDLAHD